MSEAKSELPPNFDSLRREKTRLRKIGLVVLIAGLVSAGLVYLMGNGEVSNQLEPRENIERRTLNIE